MTDLHNAGAIPGAIKSIYGKTNEFKKSTTNVIGLTTEEIARQAWWMKI